MPQLSTQSFIIYIFVFGVFFYSIHTTLKLADSHDFSDFSSIYGLKLVYISLVFLLTLSNNESSELFNSISTTTISKS